MGVEDTGIEPITTQTMYSKTITSTKPDGAPK